MDWLHRFGRSQPTEATPPEPEVSEAVERTTPGVASLLEGVSEDRSHAVLDLGPAADSSLRVYSRFARWVRFADLTAPAASREELAAAVNALPAQPARPYDLLFAWDVLDWVDPKQRPHLVERMAELTSSDARLYLVINEAGAAVRRPLRFALLDTDRMRFEPTGSPRPAMPPLLPRQVDRLLAPFRVVHAFTSNAGLREYVAVRRG